MPICESPSSENLNARSVYRQFLAPDVHTPILPGASEQMSGLSPPADQLSFPAGILNNSRNSNRIGSNKLCAQSNKLIEVKYRGNDHNTVVGSGELKSKRGMDNLSRTIGNNLLAKWENFGLEHISVMGTTTTTNSRGPLILSKPSFGKQESSQSRYETTGRFECAELAESGGRFESSGRLERGGRLETMGRIECSTDGGSTLTPPIWSTKLGGGMCSDGVTNVRNGPLTPQKLALTEITANLCGFEKTLESQTNACIQAETARIQLFREAISSLDKKISAEIKQRIEGYRALNNDFDQQIQHVLEKLETLFSGRLLEFSNLLDTVNDKISGIEKSVISLQENDNEERIMDEVGRCVEEIETVKNQFAMNSEMRNKLFLEKLAAIDRSITMRFEDEKNKRLKIMQELKDEAENFQRDHEASQAEFQARILKELTVCRNSINQECQVRERSDDDIVAALRQYTTELHSALTVGNTDRLEV